MPGNRFQWLPAWPVLNFHGHILTAFRDGPMHLAEGRGGEWFGLE